MFAVVYYIFKNRALVPQWSGEKGTLFKIFVFKYKYKQKIKQKYIRQFLIKNIKIRSISKKNIHFR